MTTTDLNRLYSIKAFHVSEKIRLKDVREKFSRPPLEFSNQEMVIRYSEDSFVFLYNYGSVVFFNVADSLQEQEISVLNQYRTLGGDFSRTNDTFLLEVNQNLEPTSPELGPNRVFFDRVQVASLSFEKIKIVCMLLAESAALEYYEILIENLLEKTNTFAKKLHKQGRIVESNKDLVRFIGMCLNTKQEIISNLYIVDSPDETWDSVQLDRIFKEVKQMMEIDTRYRALEYKIKIIQESIEIIVDLSKSRRETMLEVVIILLIAIDVVMSLIKWNL